MNSTCLNRIPATHPGTIPTPSSPATGKWAGDRRSRGRSAAFIATGVLATTALAGLASLGTIPRLQHAVELEAKAAATAAMPPVVNVATARRASGTAERLLPGNSAPLYETAISARTNGYLKRRLVDIGDRVDEGALLAEISTPEIDDQLEQARATLAQTQANLQRDHANLEYADIELERDRKLVKRGEISHEEFDRQNAAAKVAKSTVRATEATIRLNEADVQRLADLQAYQKIVAPFSGVVTVRHYDSGALITADNPTTAPLFRLAQIDVLRVFVDVPQVDSTAIKVGQTASVFRREDPERQFTGTVTRIANALDPATRTMRTEVQVPNPDGALLPGMYLQVKFMIVSEIPSVIVPAPALMARLEGTVVGVLDSENRVHYRAVQLGRDFGREVEVTSGLTGDEAVVVRPGDALLEGTIVQRASALSELAQSEDGRARQAK
jgi:RND family efflux transporter MFP subunit